MKKIIYSFIAVLALGCGFTSCGSDDDDDNISYSTPAEEASAGTYTGIWTRSLDGVDETYSGTVTLESAGKTGVTKVTFSCPESSLNATSVANIWNAKYDFMFMNQTVSTENGLGASFAGRITETGVLTTSFTITQKVGRKSYNYNYSFTGSK